MKSELEELEELKEITDLLIIELNNSSENQLIEDSVNILKLICVNEWGFAPYISIDYAIINMANFISS